MLENHLAIKYEQLYSRPSTHNKPIRMEMCALTWVQLSTQLIYTISTHSKHPIPTVGASAVCAVIKIDH
jgi:hypothetical protein